MKPDTKIVVASVEYDNYGGQTILGTDGVDYKVNKKHDHLHSRAVVGAHLILRWKHYSFNKEGVLNEGDFIDDVLINASGPDPTAPQTTPSPTPAPAVTASAPPQAAILTKDESIARAVALKVSVQAFDETCPTSEAIIEYARELIPFLLGKSPKAPTSAEPAQPATPDPVTPPTDTTEPIASRETLAQMGKLVKDNKWDDKDITFHIKDTYQKNKAKELTQQQAEDFILLLPDLMKNDTPSEDIPF